MGNLSEVDRLARGVAIGGITAIILAVAPVDDTLRPFRIVAIATDMTANIYTKTGDSGQTGLFGGPRVAKDDARIEAYGAVDELNALLGLVRCESPLPEIDELLSAFQHDLFALGAELATPEPAKLGTNWIGAEQIQRLERAIDLHDALVPPLCQFILPGGTQTAALMHVARTVCRRAERRVVTLARESQQPVSQQIVIYLNRLGDLLFVLARRVNALAGAPEESWRKPINTPP